MPKFAPNTGFRMPGLGSKEKNSASNFRDEQHVDKMGYCDNTPDAMLPSGSSPLNYKPIVDDDPYTSAKYSGELAVNIPDPRKEPKVQTEGKGDTTTNNYYGGGGAEEVPTSTPGKNTSYTKETDTGAPTTTYTEPTITEEGTKAYNALSLADQQKQDRKYKKLNTKTTPGAKTTVFKVNNIEVTEAAYKLAKSGKSKVTK